MGFMVAGRAAFVLFAVGLLTTGCSAIDAVTDRLTGVDRPKEGSVGFVRGFLGAVVADEPQAVLAARAVLSAGGNAADAAVAAGFTLAVTLPSRAGLGAGGACLAFAPESPLLGAEAVMFLPQPGGGGGDRPAAVPMMARGLFALHARYGKRPFESLIVPAEQLARFGAPVSRAFARDLDVVAVPLAGDPDTADIFLPRGRRLVEGDNFVQPDLAGAIGQLRVAGIGDLYQGGLARRLVESSQRAGGGLTAAALRGALPQYQPAPKLALGRGDFASFLPTDGGVAAGAAWRVLNANPAAADAAAARAAGVAAAWRRGAFAGNAQAALEATDALAGGLLPLPASTGFMTMDREGNAVACVVTMNNLFGTGRVAPQTGVLLAATPGSSTQPLLAAAITYGGQARLAFKGAFTGTGQEGAAMAVAVAMQQSIAARRALPNPVPEPGRANAMVCPSELPAAPEQCSWATDPRGSGLAAGGN